MEIVRHRVVQKGGQETIEEIHKIIVYQFDYKSEYDCQQSVVFAQDPVYNWFQTDAGQFVIKNAEPDPIVLSRFDHNRGLYNYAVVAELEKNKLTEFYLRWGKG